MMPGHLLSYLKEIKLALSFTPHSSITFRGFKEANVKREIINNLGEPGDK